MSEREVLAAHRAIREIALRYGYDEAIIALRAVAAELIVTRKDARVRPRELRDFDEGLREMVRGGESFLLGKPGVNNG